MPVDWKAPDSFTRLLAATVASLDGSTKLNYKKIADFYGEGATYDAIEGRFRNIKKQAGKLKEEVENGRPIAPQRGSARSNDGTPRKQRAPKGSNQQAGVLNGRVSKSTNTTPTKKRSEASVKREMMEAGSYSGTSTSSSGTGTDAATPGSNNDTTNSIVIDDYTDDFTQYAASFEMMAGHPQLDVPHQMLHQPNFWEDFDHVA